MTAPHIITHAGGQWVFGVVVTSGGGSPCSCMCAPVCVCVRTEAPSLPPNLRQAAALSLCTGAVSAVCAARLASLRTEWTRFPSHVRSTAANGREDVLLNQGIGLGKSAGRPFLFFQQQTYDPDEFFFSLAFGQDREKKREDVDSRTQRASYGSFFSPSGWGFLPLW